MKVFTRKDLPIKIEDITIEFEENIPTGMSSKNEFLKITSRKRITVNDIVFFPFSAAGWFAYSIDKPEIITITGWDQNEEPIFLSDLASTLGISFNELRTAIHAVKLSQAIKS